MKNLLYHDTTIGRLGIAEEGGEITDLIFQGEAPNWPYELEESGILRAAAEQLDEYFAGKRTGFDLSLNPAGTEFQQRVWRELQAIPYGETRTYGQVAAAVGNPKASRAVGLANNRNPIAIIIPCHRVVGANGSLTGYAGGLRVKEALLKLEQNDMQSTLL